MSALDDALAGYAASAPIASPLDVALKAHADEITLPTMRVTPNSANFVDANPTTGGSTLQVYNPFGKNLDTGIPTSQGVDRFLSGAGKAYSDIGLGARQLLTNDPTETAQLRAETADSRQRDRPLMDTGAGLSGNLAGNVAIAAPAAFVPGLNGYAGSAVAGSALGALQPAESSNERALNTALGGGAGIAGKALGDVLTRAVTPAQSALTKTQSDALAIADRLGLKTTPAQQTGSSALGRVEAMLSSHPESAGPFDKIAVANQKTVGTIAAKAVGENADNLSSTVLGQADARLGKVFDSVADKTPVTLDPQTYGPQLAHVIKDSEGMIGQNGSLADNGLIKRLDGFINDQGGASRERLRDLSSKLGKAARNNLTSASGDRELGSSLLKAQDVVEDAIVGSLSGAEKQTYAEARSQYRTLMNLTARNTVINPSNGEVNTKALASLLMSKDKGGFTFGKNNSDLYEAARFAQAFPEAVGNSGTATRSIPSIGQLPMRLAGAVGSRAYMGGASAFTKGTPDPVSMAAAKLLAELLQNPTAGRLPSAAALQLTPQMPLVNAAQ